MQKPDEFKIEGVDNYWADLSRWLVKGGAGTDSRWFYKHATDETWMSVIESRRPFVEAARDYFDECVAMRKSKETITDYVHRTSQFINWIDENELSLSLDNGSLERAFIAYDQYQYRRGWVTKEVGSAAVYHGVHTVSQLLSHITKRPPHAGLNHQSRVCKAYKQPRKTSVSRAAEKQHLADTRALGYFCVGIGNALTISAVYGQLPIAADVLTPAGVEHEFLILPRGLQNALDGNSKLTPDWARKACAPIEAINRDNSGPSEAARASLIKLRLLAEFVIFVYQTGMNVSSAMRLERKGLKYKAAGNSEWRVTSRKRRKHGPVSFSIYKDYRDRLRRFIEFVDHFFPDDQYLFPLGSEKGRPTGRVSYKLIRYHTARAGVPWIPPSVTRNTRANFLDRALGDPDLSAELAQHTRETFKQNYELPSQQRAMSELTHFWKDNPESLIDSGCDGEPEAIAGKPSDVVKPDCIHASGCLWCSKHRDIQSEDYVWSLSSFKRLKLIEAAQPVQRDIPADRVVARISEKLEAFRELNETSRRWVDESQLRVEEGDYHPTWKSNLEFWEA